MKNIYWNLTPQQLVEKSVALGQGQISDTGALVVDTGEFTGRSPKDRYIVYDDITASTVNWGEINIPFDAKKFDKLLQKVIHYLKEKEIYAREAYVCADPRYRLNIRVINEYPWMNLFCNNLFLRPAASQSVFTQPGWTIINASGFKAHPEEDGTRQHNFIILNFTQRIILIGGTAYAGEMKKSVFSVLNFILPTEKNVLPMHCAANMSEAGDTALFFGLSGTGKTTLSADPHRGLIGDDEHGWDEDGIFNFEGGCYAKCINLNEEKEPQIFRAIKFGTVLENVRFFPGTNKPNYSDKSRTENTRAAYPLHYIENAIIPSTGPAPKNIFFLTCDAFGVLPPISRLTSGQAMYHFLSGYTAKVAGTETGITEPTTTFSACFGAPFLPLHPIHYAKMLGEKIKKHRVNVWLVSTGWVGGPYGIGHRTQLAHTRAIITAALRGQLDNVEYQPHAIFGLAQPTSCPGVPTEILNPRNTWTDPSAYDAKAHELAMAFVKNFEKFASMASAEILAAAPKIETAVKN